MEGDDSVSSYKYHLRPWELWVLGLMVLSMSLAETTLVTAGLYECRNEAGTLIYTDSPAQLERCHPVGSGGPSRLGVVGGASSATPVTPAAPAPAPPTSAPSSLGSSDPTVGSSTIAPTGVPAGHSEESPCGPGVNPLNPFSAPPCPRSDGAPPATPPMPTDTSGLPPLPAQP